MKTAFPVPFFSPTDTHESLSYIWNFDLRNSAQRYSTDGLVSNIYDEDDDNLISF